MWSFLIWDDRQQRLDKIVKQVLGPHLARCSFILATGGMKMAISPCRISCLKNCGKSTAPNGSCCGPIRACARRWKPSRCARLWKTSHGTDEGRHPCDFEPEAMFLFRVRSKLAVYCAQSSRAG